MKKRRKIIVEAATSADGYIARPDGDVGWLDRPMPKGHYGLGEFMKSIDIILMGRKTYDKGIEMGMKSSFDPRVKNYIFSRKPKKSLLLGPQRLPGQNQTAWMSPLPERRYLPVLLP